MGSGEGTHQARWGPRGFRLPGGVVGGRAGDLRAAQGALSPRQPQAALPRVPYRSCPGGRRSPGAVAGRGVQGALWPSGAGGRSGHGDAGGFAEDPRLQHLGRPAAALRPRPGSAALLRDPRGCGGPGARCGLAGTGPQQQRRPQPLQEWEASRRRLGPGRCPPEEAVGSGTTPPAMLRRQRPLLEVSVARRGPGLAGLRPPRRALAASPRAGRTGRPAAAAASQPRGWGGGWGVAQTFLLASPEKLEARGGRLGPATPGSPRSGLGSGAAGCVKPGAGRVAGHLWIGRGPGKAQPLQGPARTSRREAEDACLRTAWAFPRPVLSPAESRGEGREGRVREPAPKVRGPESPWNSWSVIPPPDWAENNRLRLI